MSRHNRPRLSLPDPVAPAAPHDHAAALDAAIRYFRARDSKGWDELALCPLQHGLETIATKLRAFR